MMTYEQYLLIKLAEEAAEVSKAALKAAQFGYSSEDPRTGFNNSETLCKELDDLMAVLGLVKVNGPGYIPDLTQQDVKKTRVLHYWQVLVNNGRAKALE